MIIIIITVTLCCGLLQHITDHFLLTVSQEDLCKGKKKKVKLSL
jgi:hypothetical protein